MNSFKKYFSILLATIMLASTIGLAARRGGRNYYRGHRGYYGRGWHGGWGLGFGYGYGWPYYGLGYPGYYARPSYAKDNAGQTYWLIYNQSILPLRVQSDRDETIIPPGAMKKLYRSSSFTVRVYSKDLMRSINTRQHSIALSSDEMGRPHFKL